MDRDLNIIKRNMIIISVLFCPVIIGLALLLPDVWKQNQRVAIELLVILLITIMFYFFLYVTLVKKDNRPGYIIITDSRVRYFEEDTQKYEIIFDSTVHVDVYINQIKDTREYGPLIGYIFKSNDVRIEITELNGYPLSDIRNIRDTIQSLVDHHDMIKSKAYRNVIDARRL